MTTMAVTRETTLGAVLRTARGLGEYRVIGDDSTIVGGITLDSRAVTARSMYCCVPGARFDGHEFAEAAVTAGASVLVVERPLPLPVPQVLVSSVRSAIGPLACAVHGHPSSRVPVIGVTGTNGKTTTVGLIAHVLTSSGRPCAVSGTLTGRFTTPEAPDLQASLAAFVAEGYSAVAMEVSSHALALDRVRGTEFAIGVFTNLGRDHLDLHGSMEQYFAAKARLFDAELSRVAVVNGDDEWGRRLIASIAIPVHAYRVSELTGVVVGIDRHEYRWRGRTVRVPLGGAFNVANSLAAAETASALGVPEDDVAAALLHAPAAPGRFETIEAGQPFAVVVDYAHTPDGLEAVLTTVRAATRDGRVLVVFGCGGDRDREKRPLMGRVAADHADLLFVTSDNPRSEEPRAIIDAIVTGIPAEERSRAVVEPDRATAIEAAFRIAREGDVVVIAGKGHENTQTIGTTVLPFDDRQTARRILEALL